MSKPDEHGGGEPDQLVLVESDTNFKTEKIYDMEKTFGCELRQVIGAMCGWENCLRDITEQSFNRGVYVSISIDYQARGLHLQCTSYIPFG